MVLKAGLRTTPDDATRIAARMKDPLATPPPNPIGAHGQHLQDPTGAKAGRLLMKRARGFRDGEIGFSEKHANFW